MVAVAAVAVEAVGVGVMVILTMGLVVVTTATVAGEAIGGNCSLIRMNHSFLMIGAPWHSRKP